MEQHWVYHPKEEAKIVCTSEYKELLKNGWYDTPAAFENKPIVPRETIKEELEVVEEIPLVKKRGRPRMDASIGE